MADAGEFLCGVIEGFYGRQWNFSLRHTYAAFLAAAKLNTYLYCPKGDPRLRSEWQQRWSDSEYQQLRELAATCAQVGVRFGVGLSPLELYRNYGSPEREQLRRKLDHISGLQAPLLAILFDDMPGDLDALAVRQAEIVDDVCRWQPELRVLVCPTYYSFDPALENFFGAMPANYWQDLGAALPPQVDLFWTGNKVCSDAISDSDIASIQRQLNRPVILWDNYPVNDGEVRSKRLYLEPLADRDPALQSRLTGHLCNPMNQGLLSMPALLGLAELYGDAAGAQDAVVSLLGEPVWRCLQKDREEFATVGLEGMGTVRCEELAQRYRKLPGAAAREVEGWLTGEYTWDPSCLTG